MAPIFSLIFNPVAGGGRTAKMMPEVQRCLASLGASFDSTESRDLQHARSLARARGSAGAIVVAIGGDGLIGAVAGELETTGATLGIIPGGRGNDFARVLGIPTDVKGACSLLVGPERREIDIGSVDGHWFVGIASAGYDSDANAIANSTKLISGSAVYCYAALRALAGWKPARFDLEIDDRLKLSYTGYSIVCANSKAYGGGMFVAPDAELDDGLLDIVMTGDTSKARFLMSLPKVFKGTHVDNPSVGVQRGSKVRVSADRPFVMYADGDPIAQLPATVEIHHRALRVIAPR
ncbi:MAG: diacylglycerol kinase family lipid kinase [Solirubrobacterales bacterium]|nr:diacylglycerol kinase family lipid kinase [Solirubrobacterales bacterium]